tara:strand:+ start:1193 stop:1489 length:297 start_codon:yes stop_codon:yes gene_type:complete
MNKHSEQIKNLHLSSKESLGIALEIIAFVRQRGSISLDMALKKEDQSKFEPVDYITMAQVISETESVLRLLSAAIDGEALDALDQIFPLEAIKKSPEQ